MHGPPVHIGTTVKVREANRRHLYQCTSIVANASPLQAWTLNHPVRCRVCITFVCHRPVIGWGATISTPHVPTLESNIRIKDNSSLKMLRLWNFELHYHGDVLNQFRWLNYAIADGREQVQALMTQLLQLSGEGQRAKVLEIGTGSGYQTALLVQMGWQVYTIEIEPHLQARATTWLTDAGYMATGRLHTRLGDGYLGWPSAARFNGIIGEQHSKPAVCGGQSVESFHT